MKIYILLFLWSLLPVALSIIFYFLKRKTNFINLNYWLQQIIIGVIFGVCAILGTEFGVTVTSGDISAVANVRDAAPLCAGLFFGGPAGLMAGAIGAIERVFTPIGDYSRIACSVSTALAGVYAALLRKYMLDGKRPTFFMAFIAGIVMEVVHLTILFLTHLEDPQSAIKICQVVTIPMLLFNGLAVMLSSLAISFLSIKVHNGRIHEKTISQEVRAATLVVVIIAYILTTSFVFVVQTNIAKRDIENEISLIVKDLSSDISQVRSEENLDLKLVKLAYNIKDELLLNPSCSLNDLCTKYGINEINKVNSAGIIYETTNENFLNFDMNTGTQAIEFLKLISDPECLELVQKFQSISANAGIMRKYAGVKFEDGLLQIGYDEPTYQEDIKDEIINATKDRYIIGDGKAYVLDQNYNLLNGTDELGFNFYELIKNNNQNEMFKSKVEKDNYFSMYGVANDVYVLIVIPETDAFESRNSAIYINSFMEVIVFAAIYIMLYTLIKKLVVNNVITVNDKLAQISSGNLDVTLDIKQNKEFSDLSFGINETVGTLKQYIKDAESRMDAELALAKSIQHSALPSIFPAFPQNIEFDIYAKMYTAKEVGGDFYDFYMLDNNRLAFIIADVSGKGIPAAMFMMRSKTMIKNLAETGIPVDEIFKKANNKLCSGNDAEMFVTAWMGILDLSTGHLEYANAGHNPPLIYKKGQGFSFLSTKPGFILAGMENINYKSQSIDLSEGDAIYLYTDGVTEATNINDELYGNDRLVNFLNKYHLLNAKDMLHGIKDSIDDFAGEREQFDDITMMMVNYFGKEGNSMKQKTFEASTDRLNDVSSFVEEELENNDAMPKVIMQISVALEEIFVNIAHYAYPGGVGSATVTIKVDDDVAYISFIDNGIPFNPLEKADPDITLDAADRDIGGLGIYMVKKSMDDVTYEYINQQNILTIIKKIK